MLGQLAIVKVEDSFRIVESWIFFFDWLWFFSGSQMALCWLYWVHSVYDAEGVFAKLLSV